MTAELMAWLQDSNWQSLLVPGHISGMMLGAFAALAGVMLGARVLFLRARRPARAMLRLIHGGVVLGLVLLWASGAGLLHVKGALAPADWPTALAFKIGVLALLSLCVSVTRRSVLPLVQDRLRPVAADLSLREVLGVSCLSAFSTACWIMLVATGLSAPMRDLSLVHLSGMLAAIAVLLALCCLVLSVVVRRRVLARASSAAAREAASHRPFAEAEAVSAPVRMPEPVRAGVTQAPEPAVVLMPPPRPAAAEAVQWSGDTVASAGRMCEVLPPDAHAHLRERLAQEWSRGEDARNARRQWVASAAAVALSSVATEADADDARLRRILDRQR